MTLGLMLVGGVYLAIWRQVAPPTVVEAVLWAGGWLVFLFLQAVVWHWLLRSGRLLYQDGAFDDIRNRPDAPWGV